MRLQRTLRRLLETAIVAAVVTVIAALALSANVGAGFQRRASDALFPSAQTDDSVVVVHLTTPNHLHYPQAKQVLAAGKEEHRQHQGGEQRRRQGH